MSWQRNRLTPSQLALRLASVLSAPLTLCVLLMLVILNGCATTTASVATEPTFCDTARPITWSSRDTDHTIDEVKQHNARGIELCGWGQ